MPADFQIIEQLGVARARVERQVEILEPHLPQLAARFVALLAASADPILGLAAWERLFDAAPDLGLLNTWPEQSWQALFALLGSSPSLANVLHNADSNWVALFASALGAPRRDAAMHAAALADAYGSPWTEFAERLRRHRHSEYLRIGLADLVGIYPVEITVQELSSLADGLAEAAYGWAREQLRGEYGELLNQAGAAMPFVVFGMGKLGGQELNFSSDVDLVYLYESNDASSRGGSRGTLDARQYCTRLAELITRALHEVTAAGFAFRVDLRLRPDGMNGPIANSLSNALLYYESYGQTWERTAMIQARPIAGDKQLGETFLREIRPFVYRRYLDYATVADMKEMKARVESQLAEKGESGNVKLGRGGIREIEFLVQVFQLIHGGRDDRVRTRGSLIGLQRLVECRYVAPEDGAALSAAYRFLRNVEHKIQIVHQRQTHTVPSDQREQLTLARRLGYRGVDPTADLWKDLERHNQIVRRAFERLFHEPSAENERSADPVTQGLLRGLDDRAASLAALQTLGFLYPDEAYEHLRLLRDGSPNAPARPKRRQVLIELAPALFNAIRQSADPDLALKNLATFISSVGARTSFLVLLRENPGTLRMMVQVFGASQFLANAFIRRPDLLDSLVRTDLVRVRRSLEDLSAELQSLLAGAEGFEVALDVLRRFRNQEFLRVGINDVQGVLEPEEVVAELALIAEACVRAACEVARREICERARVPGLPGKYAVIAMGKLGGGELNYNSDLDLIFVYEEGGDEEERSRAHELFTKFVQRMITVLQVPTPDGVVYYIDTRLRPSGRSGPLVSSLEGFRRYHEESAQTWERQALIKARPIAGDLALGEKVRAVIEQFVYRTSLTAKDVREIRRLRDRMERELAKEDPRHRNLKTGRGGLVDVEFLTQMLQLMHGRDEPRLRVRNTLDALAALATAGILSAADHQVLAEGYRFIRRVEKALRLAHDRPVEDLGRDNLDLARVARRLGYNGAAQQAGELFWKEFTRHREAIRACYEDWFKRAQRQLPQLSETPAE